MPVPQSKLDALTELVVDQLLAEFETAKAEGKSVDPRRIVAAQRLLESASPRDAFRATEPEPVPRVAEEAAPVAKVHTSTRVQRNTTRKLSRMSGAEYLTQDDVDHVNAWAEIDGAEMIALPPKKDEPAQEAS